MKAYFLIASLLVSGCATASIKDFQVEGAKGSALCITGGPGGRLGIGPGGIVSGAKVNDDFVGIIAVTPDCAIQIQSYPAPKVGPSIIN